MKRTSLLCFILVLISILSPVFSQDAYSLRQTALQDIQRGNGADAQEKLIRAYEMFLADQNWEMASMCLYERAIEYMNIGDLANMNVQHLALKELLKHENSSLIRYNYHSVASGYYSYTDSIDLALRHGEAAIKALEQIENPYQYNIVPVWSYYNQAFFYDIYFQPERVDSVKYYLSLAREVNKLAQNHTDSLEALISIIDLEAWQEYYVQDYKRAESMMKNVLQMIDSVALISPNTVITERGEAYKFLAMINQEQGRWQNAYHYQQYLLENNELRYDMDKRMALQEVQTKYEVETQTLEIEKLAAENRSNRWIMVALWLLLVAMALGYWLLMMGRKNAESKLYEAALEADNMRQAIIDLEAQTDVEPLQLLVDGLVQQLYESAEHSYTKNAIECLRELDLGHIQVLLGHGKKITTMDKRYILCFAAGMTVEEIAEFMCLEPASVYTVRYRLRKKFTSDYPFPY